MSLMNGRRLLLFQCTKRARRVWRCGKLQATLTCVACKLMECVIAKHVYVHLSNNNLLSHAQHGFVGGHSTCTNLLECLNDCTLSLQDNKSVIVAYIDFSRAFYTVSHKKC